MSDRAARIKKAATFEVECPSGNKYLVRKGSPEEIMMLTGEIPIPPDLLPEGAGEADALNQPPQIKAEEENRNLALSRLFCGRYVIDPVIVFEDYKREQVFSDGPFGVSPEKVADAEAKEHANEVAYWQVSGDVTYLVQKWAQACMGIVDPKELESFRKGPGGDAS